jgi:hypothetical protein
MDLYNYLYIKIKDMNKKEIPRPEKEFSTLITRLKEALKNYEESDYLYGEYVANGLHSSSELKEETYLNYCQRESLRGLFVDKKTNKKVSKGIQDDNWVPFIK